MENTCYALHYIYSDLCRTSVGMYFVLGCPFVMEKELILIIFGGIWIIIYYWYFTNNKITSITNEQKFEFEYLSKIKTGLPIAQINS